VAKMDLKPYEFKTFRVEKNLYAVDGYPIWIKVSSQGYYIFHSFSKKRTFVINMASAMAYAKLLIQFLDKEIYEVDVKDVVFFPYKG